MYCHYIADAMGLIYQKQRLVLPCQIQVSATDHFPIPVGQMIGTLTYGVNESIACYSTVKMVHCSMYSALNHPKGRRRKKKRKKKTHFIITHIHAHTRKKEREREKGKTNMRGLMSLNRPRNWYFYKNCFRSVHVLRQCTVYPTGSHENIRHFFLFFSLSLPHSLCICYFMCIDFHLRKWLVKFVENIPFGQCICDEM